MYTLKNTGNLFIMETKFNITIKFIFKLYIFKLNFKLTEYEYNYSYIHIHIHIQI